MDEFLSAARVFSLFFLVIQSIALIDTAYHIHHWMIKKENTAWDIINLSLSLLILGGCIVAVGFLFEWFTTGGDCHIEKFVLSTVVIVPVLYTIASATETIEHGALFVSALTTGYIVKP